MLVIEKAEKSPRKSLKLENIVEHEKIENKFKKKKIVLESYL